MIGFRPYILWVGRGRLAQHLRPDWERTLAATYDTKSWDRSQPISILEDLIKNAAVIALAISDRAIEPFYKTHSSLNPNAHWIHFSGASEFAGLQSFHPLMSFGPKLYDAATYARIPYVTSGAPMWPAHLPLTNPLFHLKPEDKAKYHALCVLSGNFSTLLWEKAQREFTKLGLSPAMLQPYAEICLRNVFQDPATALTGPLVRGDEETMNNNLQALAGDPYQAIYRAFKTAVPQEKS